MVTALGLCVSGPLSSLKMAGNVPKVSDELEPVISRSQPVHLQLAVELILPVHCIVHPR